MEKLLFAELEGMSVAALDALDGIGVELHVALGHSRSAQRIFLTREQAIHLSGALLDQVKRLQEADSSRPTKPQH